MIDDELDLFTASPARARTTDPSTSHERAGRINASGEWKTIREGVVHTLATTTRKLTSFQVADIIGHPVQNVSPVFAPLEREGLIEVCGKSKGRNLYRLRRQEPVRDAIDPRGTAAHVLVAIRNWGAQSVDELARALRRDVVEIRVGVDELLERGLALRDDGGRIHLR